MGRLARRRARDRRARTRALHPRAAGRQGAPLRRLPALPRADRVHQHDPSAPGGALARATRRSSSACARWCAGTRWRWCCARASKDLELGGHIASFASAATLYDVGFNHFWHAPSETHGGDLIYFQGHSAPGVYARAFLEGRLTEEQLDNFRQEVDGKGISSLSAPVAHAGLLAVPDGVDGPRPDAGDLPGALPAATSSIAASRRPSDRKVWAFMGDGEMDEPESLGAIGMAVARDARQPDLRRQLQSAAPRRPGARQRQDHPGARSDFRGAGWNVIKVIWGSYWDPLIARDKDGILLKRMEEAVDGEYQNFKANDGAYVREHFFGKYPELRAMVANMSDEDIWRLNRGGHDPHKVYAAYAAAVEAQGPADRDPRQDRQGLRHGRSRAKARTSRTSRRRWRPRRIKAVPRPLQHPDPRRQARGDAVTTSPPEDSPEMQYLQERARRRWAAPCRSAGARPTVAAGAEARGVQGAARSAPAKAARSRPRWRSCACSRRSCGTRTSASTSCRSCPTSRARSAWKACSASSASIRRGPALRAGGHRPAHVLQGGQATARSSQEGINEAGAHVLVDRGGDVVLAPTTCR